MRIAFHSPEVAIVSLACSTGQFQNPFNGISIFDWPEQNHTSPISMFWMRVTSPSENSMLCGVKSAAGVCMLTCHLPSASERAVIVRLFHEGVTLTVVFGVALPHRFTSVCCCNTAWSLRISGNTTLADKRPPTRDSKQSAMIILFIFFRCLKSFSKITNDRRFSNKSFYYFHTHASVVIRTFPESRFVFIAVHAAVGPEAPVPFAILTVYQVAFDELPTLHGTRQRQPVVKMLV